MLQHIKTLLKGKLVFIAIIVTIGILYLSLMKVPKLDIQISNLDKWEHCFAYFILTFFWLLAFYKKQQKLLVVFCCILFGIIIEILQHTITNYRTGDYLDVIANSLGVLFGLLVFNQIFKKK